MVDMGDMGDMGSRVGMERATLTTNVSIGCATAVGMERAMGDDRLRPWFLPSPSLKAIARPACPRASQGRFGLSYRPAPISSTLAPTPAQIRPLASAYSMAGLASPSGLEARLKCRLDRLLIF